MQPLKMPGVYPGTFIFQDHRKLTLGHNREIISRLKFTVKGFLWLS